MGQISMAAARVNKEYTQQEMAEKMHVSKQTIVNWEKGRVIPRPAQFEMFCRICEMSTGDILVPEKLIKS